MLAWLLPWRKRIADLESANGELVRLNADLLRMVETYREEAAEHVADISRKNRVLDACAGISRTFNARFNALVDLDGVDAALASRRIVREEPVLWSAVVLSERVRAHGVYRGSDCDALLALARLFQPQGPAGRAVDDLLGNR